MTGDRTGARFATTRWSIVVAAGGSAGADAREALETLCRTYWYPLYAYARRRGANRESAEDLVQGFFAMLLERGSVAAADPQRGRFRAFLLTAFQRFNADEHDRAIALKRGGGVRVLAFDFDEGESRYCGEPSHDLTPERWFERRFALALLARTLARLEADRPGDADLLPFVGGKGDAPPYAEIAKARGTSEGAVKVSVHRLRARYRECLRAEIRETVADDADVDDEIRHLLAVLRS
ncbi:MAG: sigma-70 family RNA polymerase sigma factor [Planctomycetes bacterium]|nr:sigma-70 family RNA polymerase sigma factor [Planctomycetota bacterium]